VKILRIIARWAPICLVIAALAVILARFHAWQRDKLLQRASIPITPAPRAEQSTNDARHEYAAYAAYAAINLAGCSVSLQDVDHELTPDAGFTMCDSIAKVGLAHGLRCEVVKSQAELKVTRTFTSAVSIVMVP